MGDGKARSRAEFDELTMILVDVAIEEREPQSWPILDRERTVLMVDPVRQRSRAYAAYEPTGRLVESPLVPAFAGAPGPRAAQTTCARRMPPHDPTRWFAFVCGFLTTVLAWAVFVKAPPKHELTARHHGVTIEDPRPSLRPHGEFLANALR